MWKQLLSIKSIKNGCEVWVCFKTAQKHSEDGAVKTCTQKTTKAADKLTISAVR